MTVRKTRVVREGDAKRAAARAAEIAAKLATERDRHRGAMQEIVARRSVAALKPDAAVRAAALAVVAAAAAKEEQRHRAKIDAVKKNNRR